MDYVSQSIIYLSTDLKDIYKTYHLVNPSPKTSNDIVQLINDNGHDIKLVNYQEFIDIMDKQQENYHSVTTELMRFNPIGSEAGESSYASAQNTKKVLEEQNINCAPVDERLIKTYLDYCMEVGYLE